MLKRLLENYLASFKYFLTSVRGMILAAGFHLLHLLHAFLELLDLFGRQLRTIDLDGQLVELGGERERRL
jgi:hypothetical protein